MAFLKDGMNTYISLNGTGSGSIPTTLKEISVTPPKLDGTGKIDQSTMRNSRLRTALPKVLLSLDECKITVSYDPSSLNAILSCIQVNQSITIQFPDTHTWTFWGWVDTFALGELKDGDRPTAEITIIPSNLNGSGVETLPVYA